MSERALFLALLLVVASAPRAQATDYYVKASGAWSDVATWGSSCAGGTATIPAPLDSSIVHLCPGNRVTVPCGVNPTFSKLVDEPGDWSAGGGFVMDHASCAPDQVGVITVNNQTPNAAGVVIDDMQAPAELTLRGRRIYDGRSERLGATNFLASPACGGTQPCFESSWEADGAPADVVAAMQPGAGHYRLIRMESGQYVHDAFPVMNTTSGPARLRFTPGAPDDDAGSPDGGPSLKEARAVTVQSWITSNPNRITAVIPFSSGVVPSYARDGRCLVMGSGSTARYYRIAATINNSGSSNHLGLDPWTTLAAEDIAGGPAVIAPCLRPGDRFSAFEPVVMKPRVFGAPTNNDFVGLVFRASICPVLESFYLPDATGVAQDDASSEGVLAFIDPPANCHIRGPVVQKGLRGATAVTPNVVSIWGANGFVFDQLSSNGFFRTFEGSDLHHGVQVGDSRGVVLDRWSVSWSNHGCGRVESQEAAQDDRAFEGVELTVRNSNCHDVIVGPSQFAAPGRGWACEDAAGAAGSVACRFENDLVWSVPTLGIAIAGKNDGVARAVVRDSVVAYIRPDRLSIPAPSAAVAISDTDGRGLASGWAANNVLPATWGRSSGGMPIGYSRSGPVAYSWIGEHKYGLRWFEAGAVDPRLYGVIFDAQGPGTSARAGIHFDRSLVGGTFTIRDLVVRRLCTSTEANGVVDAALAPSAARLDWQRLTLGLACAEYDSASNEGAAPAGAAAIRIGAQTGADEQLAGSTFADWVIANGDDGAGDPGGESDEWSTWGILGSGCSESCATFRDVTCTANRVGAAASAGCTSDTGAATLENVDRVDQAGVAPIGARYAGILRRSSAFENFGLPQDGLTYRAHPDDAPDLAVLPLDLRRSLTSPPLAVSTAPGSSLSITGTPRASFVAANALRIEVDGVANADGAAPSAALRLEVWALESPLGDEAGAVGHPLAVSRLAPLAAGAAWSAIDTTVAATPPPHGFYCTTLVLTEHLGGRWLARAWTEIDCGTLGDPIEPTTDPDPDHDGWPDPLDRCPAAANPDQADADGDDIGDACEPCSNGVDDDGDGKIDWPADPGCASAHADRENPQCDNGLDDDGDGKIDHAGAGAIPADPQCAGRPFGNSELPRPGCGLGAEIAVLLLAISRRLHLRVLDPGARSHTPPAARL